MDQVKQILRYHHYSYRTEKTYCEWIRRYVKFLGEKAHPNRLGKKEVEGWVQKHVSAVVSPLDHLEKRNIAHRAEGG